MIQWLRKILGIKKIEQNIIDSKSEFKNQIIENNSEIKQHLVDINSSIENLMPKKEIKTTEIIDSFSLILKNQDSSLDFKLNNTIELDKSWALVSSQNNASNFLSQIAGGSTAASAIAYTASGLYTATANTSTLMTYANGSLSSITMNGSQIRGHAGFVAANPAVFIPILAFQFASMFTGQYYFNGLSKQLTSIQNGINEILNLHHNERLAKLRYANANMIDINRRNFFTLEDYVMIDTLKYDLSIIRYEYLLAAQQEVFNAFENDKLIKKEDTIVAISSDSDLSEKNLLSEKNKKLKSIISAFSKKTENSFKKVKKISDKVTESKFFQYLDLTIKSELIFQSLKLLELKVNLADRSPNENRIGKIEELYESIINFNLNDSIYYEIKELKTNLKDGLLSKVEAHRENSTINKSKIDKKREEILKPFEDIEKYLDNKDLVFEDINQLKRDFEIPHQILIDNRTEPIKIYTKAIM